MLTFNNKKDFRWDLVSLGEVLLRFDPENERIQTARSFRVFDGGAEYNVARNLAKTFRRKTAIVTALADNALGLLAEDFILQSGVDASEILWREVSSETRNGIYFIECGFGLRPPNSCFDRANTAVSQLKTGDVDWRKIFAEKGARWFHTGGVFTGLSDTTPDAAKEAMQAARELVNQYKNKAIIGAGTVLDKNTAQKCIEVGAEFIVSPIFNAEIVSFCNRNEITVMAGALTPTEIYTARIAGADMVKVFPVSAMGGASYVEAVKAVLRNVEIVPTGGVKLENAVEYLKAGALAVGMGGELTNEKESVITNHAYNLLRQIKSI